MVFMVLNNGIVNIKNQIVHGERIIGKVQSSFNFVPFRPLPERLLRKIKPQAFFFHYHSFAPAGK